MVLRQYIIDLEQFVKGWELVTEKCSHMPVQNQNLCVNIIVCPLIILAVLH